MHRLALALVVGGLLLGSGCDKTRRLSAVERDHFQAVKIFMEPDTQKKWLKLKTEEDRNAALKKLGLWDAFYQFDERKRADILAGDVKVGWEEVAVNMAWGKPHGRFSVAGRKAEQSYELQYRFEVDPYGAVTVWTPKSKTEHKAALLYRVQLTMDDGRVAKMVRTDCVPNWNYCNDIKWTKGE
jgi:hypothetical protein